MLNGFFLTYANNSFQENPDNLYKVFYEIYDYLHPDQLIEINPLDFFLKHVIAFAKDNNPRKADSRRSKLRSALRFPKLSGSIDIWLLTIFNSSRLERKHISSGIVSKFAELA